MGDTIYQTVNFHFQVNFNFGSDDMDVSFQSVTGLDSTLETEAVKEGGENRFTHMIPVRRKYGPLILKRGLLKPSDSKLTAWLKDAFDNGKVVPRDMVNIILLNQQHKALMHWKVNNVWPLSWKIGELNAEQGAVLIETLELNYNILILDNQ
ncbi:MAG TPA: phage tail protein [Puia sp.]